AVLRLVEPEVAILTPAGSQPHEAASLTDNVARRKSVTIHIAQEGVGTTGSAGTGNRLVVLWVVGGEDRRSRRELSLGQPGNRRGPCIGRSQRWTAFPVAHTCPARRSSSCSARRKSSSVSMLTSGSSSTTAALRTPMIVCCWVRQFLVKPYATPFL